MVAFILLLTWATLQVQTALAGFLNGESLWAKAQKQAVVSLLNYASTGDLSNYSDFQHNMAVLDSYREARTKVQSGNFKYAEVERDMRRGGAMPVAIPKAIFLLDHFADAPYMRQALRLWGSTDEAVENLKTIGANLHHAYSTGTLSASEIIQQRDRINAINKFIQPRSKKFSFLLAKGTVVIGRVTFVSVLVLAAAAMLLWLLMARRTLARVRGSEERYRVLFDSAPDAIVMVDEGSGRILDANRTASTWTGRDTEELQGVSYKDLFTYEVTRKGATGNAELRGGEGGTRPVEMQSSMAAWDQCVVRQIIMRDVSERLESERDRRIAAEALASIEEGVIITDAERRAVSANGAATRLTGFPVDKLLGMRLEASRLMPDGSPLSAGIWEEIVTSRHWSGEVQNRRYDGRVYPEQLSVSAIGDAEHGVMHYVAVFSDISVAKADQRRLEHLAAHDPLTGLVNRARFQLYCDAAIERTDDDRSVVAVLFIDLDAFKFVNDSHSHAIGDRLLSLVGERIQRYLREGDIAGRIGGDEFTVLLSGLTIREDAAVVARRILSALSEPFQVGEYEIVVSASIGIAGFPLDGDGAEKLIANADAAMYVAKSEERNTWRFYVPMMQADANRRMALAMELRQALREDEFRLVYQPSLELRSGRIVGVEALLRWQHPERGEVMPGEFISIAERIGLIHLIDDWVMQEVCARIRVWDELGLPKFRVAVNVSARWFSHPGFVESVRHALQMNNIAPKRIVLEITEGAMLRLSGETEQTMHTLQALGVRVAIDDFGTGYASMAYLKFPAVSYLKIDRSFIAGLPDSTNDAAITMAMLAMADSLGLSTIAEGIETKAQHEFLLRAGCPEGQGFLYSYPLPASEIERMLGPQRNLAGGANLKLVSRDSS
jgi:diguanylate cyclase (GGDEF)-like protein/PAS domain S-box-containing protein